MILFPLNSAEDLICRGYKSNEILLITNIDTGYNNNKYKSILKDIDRTLYKHEHINQRFSKKQLHTILKNYANGQTKKEILESLQIHDYERFNLKNAFSYVNMLDDFLQANKENKKNYLTKGMVNKYETDNPFKLTEFQEKASNTRLAKFGGRYTLSNDSSLSKNARQKSINTNRSQNSKNKRKQTNIKRYGGPSPSYHPNVQLKIQKTSKKIYGTLYPIQSKLVQKKIIDTNLKRYGVKTTLLNPDTKQKSIETNLNKYGVPYFSQLPEQRERQSEYMRTHQKQIIQKKKENKTIKTSNQETIVFEYLQNIYPDIIPQYMSKEYPHACDFYIPSRKLYIELNLSWTHNSHWYNPESTADQMIAEKWKKSTKYYQNAYKTWTYYDVNKRKNAQNHNLNYIVFWQSDLSDFYLWINLGLPDAKDWQIEYSWLPTIYISKENKSKIIPLKNGSKTITKIARQFMYPIIYKREINMWNNNVMTKKGRIQPFIFSNRFKYIKKAPHDLTDLDIIRGINISGQIRAYTAFDNTLMKQIIEKYQPQSIFDPCAGWGERLLTAASYDIPYYGQDINPELKKSYENMIKAYNLKNQSVNIIDSKLTHNKADMLLTCPPYGNTEIYSQYGSENLSEKDFLQWWNTIIQKSDVNYIAFQINQKWKNLLSNIVIKNNFILIEELSLHKQKSHLNKNKKEYESMMIFKKNN